MGGWAARKALQVVGNVEHILSVELLAACQGIDFLRPLKTTPCLEAVHKLVRSVVPHYEKDRFMAPDIEAATELIRSGKLVDTIRPFVDSKLL
jgi:histidine ammonia-lyase